MVIFRFLLIALTVIISGCGGLAVGVQEEADPTKVPSKSATAQDRQAAVASLTPAASEQTPEPGIGDRKVYQDTEYAFEITYPVYFDLKEHPSDWPGFFPMIETKNEKPVVLVSVPTHAYENTNLEGASFLITVYEGLCTDEGAAWDGEGGNEVTINGIPFLKRITGDGATGHTILLEIYETPVDRSCYRLILNIQSFRFEAEGGLIDFGQDQEIQRFLVELENVVNTFKFLR